LKDELRQQGGRLCAWWDIYVNTNNCNFRSGKCPVDAVVQGDSCIERKKE